MSINVRSSSSCSRFNPLAYLTSSLYRQCHGHCWKSLFSLPAADSFKDLTPLSECKKLKKLNIRHVSHLIEDLSPLSQCLDLEELDISNLPLIKDLSFFGNGFTKLRVLRINWLPVDDFSPLIKPPSPEELTCLYIPIHTSLLPLARCNKLRKLTCMLSATDLDMLREKVPQYDIVLIGP